MKNPDALYINLFKSIEGADGAWYKVISFLGKGGNGTSYLVLCTGGKYQGCIFTLKVLHRISQQERIDKFLREIAFMKECSYPTILRQYDQGEWNGHPYVVTDYMTCTLVDSIRKGDVSFGKKLLFSLQLLSSLKYLKSKGVVHRDIKPGNIFIKDDTAILGDFGLIKRINDDNEEDVEELKGYFAMPHSYRTPELVAYAKSEGRICFESDVFQLGLVLCELFTGKNPLKESKDGLSPIQLTPIPNMKHSFGNRVLWIIRKMLTVEKDKRFSLENAQKYFNILFSDYVIQRNDLDGEVF